MDTCQLTSSQGGADGVSEQEYDVAGVGGGVNLPCGWYRIRGQLPSTGGRDHTHSHTVSQHSRILLKNTPFLMRIATA
jgi:hypothetical protein